MQNAITEDENIRQGPHGLNEPVPSRSGVGTETKHPISPTDDNMTFKRRQRYGDTERYGTPVGLSEFLQMTQSPNTTILIRNPTRDSQINGTFQRASTQ